MPTLHGDFSERKGREMDGSYFCGVCRVLWGQRKVAGKGFKSGVMRVAWCFLIFLIWKEKDSSLVS